MTFTKVQKKGREKVRTIGWNVSNLVKSINLQNKNLMKFKQK